MRKMNVVLWILVIGIGGWAYAAGNSPGAAADPPEKNAPQHETQMVPPADAQQNQRVVARIDGHPIYFHEVEKRVDNFEKKFQEVNPLMKLPEDKRIQIRQDMLDRMVKEKIMELAAATGHYPVTDAEIDERINQLQTLFGEGEEARQRFLGGISDMAEFRDNIARQVRIDKYIEAVQKNQVFDVADAEVRAYYDTNIDKFNREETVRISQINWRLPPVEDPVYAEKLKTAMDKAEAAMKEAQSGTDFSELAKKYSEDPKAAETGGDMGFVRRKQLVEPLEKVVFALAPGEVSSPVTTQFGVFLLKAIEKTEPRVLSFDEVKQDIRDGLLRTKKGKSRDQIYQDLKNKTKVEVLL